MNKLVDSAVVDNAVQDESVKAFHGGCPHD